MHYTYLYSSVYAIFTLLTKIDVRFYVLSQKHAQTCHLLSNLYAKKMDKSLSSKWKTRKLYAKLAKVIGMNLDWAYSSVCKTAGRHVQRRNLVKNHYNALSCF